MVLAAFDLKVKDCLKVLLVIGCDRVWMGFCSGGQSALQWILFLTYLLLLLIISCDAKQVYVYDLVERFFWMAIIINEAYNKVHNAT